MDGPIVLEGWISILAALTAGSRDIEALYLQRDVQSASVTRLEREAEGRGVPVSRVDASVVQAHATGRSHGGAVAIVGPRRYQTLDDLGTSAASPFIVMLDGVEDPFNFGQAIRALYAAGADGLVVRPRVWDSASGTVARASAGASELIPTAVAETPMEAVLHFKGTGLAVACTYKGSRATSLYEADLTSPLFVLIGGERRGIARSVIDKADMLIQVPYGSGFQQSLGTTSAASVIAFEALRQRRDRERPVADA